MFSWIPIYTELARQILAYRNRQGDLINMLDELHRKTVPTTLTTDRDKNGKQMPLTEIDPFTFFASFNRSATEENRRAILTHFKARFGLQSPLPTDFDGVPILSAQNSWFFAFKYKRGPDDVSNLWTLAEAVVGREPETLDPKLYESCLNIAQVGQAKLTMGLFWLNPQKYVACDANNRKLFEQQGIDCDIQTLPRYLTLIKNVNSKIGTNYPEISRHAWELNKGEAVDFALTNAQLEHLWARFNERITGFIDFESPGAAFRKLELDYKHNALKRYQEEIGNKQMREWVEAGQGQKALEEISKRIQANLVAFQAWRTSLGSNDKQSSTVLRAYLDAVKDPYVGPATSEPIIQATVAQGLRPSWDTLSTVLWAMRPSDFFPIKISYYRKLADELGHQLPDGPPTADKFHELMKFGQAFWDALKPQKPKDWIDVQSFIWAVCPRARSMRNGLEAVMREYIAARTSGPVSKENKVWKVFVDLCASIRSLEPVERQPHIKVRFSVGQGNYNKVPWIAQMDDRETDTTQHGVYGVFLFRQDMSGVYLTLAQGVTEPRKRLGAEQSRVFLRSKAETIRTQIRDLEKEGFSLDNSIDLKADPGLGADYEDSVIAYKSYEKDRVPEDDVIETDIGALLQAYAKYIEHVAHPKLLWNREGAGYDLILTNPEHVSAMVKRLLETFLETTHPQQSGANKHIRNEFKAWVGNPSSPLRYKGYVTLSNWFNPGEPMYSDSTRGKLAGQIWDLLFLCRPQSRLSISPQRAAEIDPAAFERWWAEQSRLQSGGESEDKSMVHLTQSSSMNLILYGPPGTGKTYQTIERTVKIIDPYFSGDHAAHKRQFDDLMRRDRIGFITFHQSYSYEDFIEGIRPVVDVTDDEAESPRYECRPGLFKRMAYNALFDCLEPVDDVSQLVPFETLWKALISKIESDPQIKFSGLTDRTSYRLTLTARGNIEGTNLISNTRFLCTRKVLEKVFNAKRGQDSITASDVMDVVARGCHSHLVAAIFNELRRIERADFAGGVQQKRQTTTLSGEEKADIVQRFLTNSDESGYKIKPEAEWNRFVLIIDEINRGNISKILGELITLIEADKRLRPDADNNSLIVTLPYSGDKFAVPPNLHLLATMNTADKSIALVDVALRRRFDFEEIPVKLEVCKDLSDNMRSVLAELNRRIILRKDRDHQIGHAYFVSVADEQSFNQRFRKQIIPLLQEYFFNDWDGLRFVLGENHALDGDFICRISGADVKEARTKWQWFLDAGKDELNCLQTLRTHYQIASIEEKIANATTAD